MSLAVHEDQGVTVVSVAGELDATHTTELNQVFDRLLAEGHRQFVIDLKQVGFVDSAGLSALIRCFKRVRNGMGTVSLADLQPAVRRVLTLTRLDRAFDVRANVAEAVEHFTGQ